MLRLIRRTRRGSALVVAACGGASLVVATPASHADTFTWSPVGFSGNGSGSWPAPTNWANANVATGIDNTADFSTLNITALSTVTLDGDQLIGNLKFGDATSANNNWIVAQGSGGTLTLQTSGAAPTINVVNQTTTISAPLASSQGLVKSGAGTLVLTGANSFSGTTLISLGAVQIGNANALGGGDVSVISGGGPTGAALAFNAGFTFTNNVTLAGISNGGGTLFSNSAGSNVVSGNITLLSGSGGARIGSSNGAGSLFVSGTITGGSSGETLQVRSLGGNTVFTGANSYSNTTNIIEGTLQIAGGDNRLPINTALKLGFVSLPSSLSRFDLNGFNQQLLGLDYDASVTSKTNEVVTNLSATPSTLTLSGSTNYTYGGVIQGNLTLVKTGTNRQTLSGTSGANTYTGATIVNNGSLVFNGASNLGGTGASLTINASGVAGAGYAIDQALVNRVNATSSGALALAVSSTNSLDLTGIPDVVLGALGTVTYGGSSLTVGPRGYRIGGGGGTITFTSPNVLTGTNGLTVQGNGNVILTGANNYSGTTFISTGSLLLQNDGFGNSTASNTAGIAMGNTGVLKLQGGITVTAPITANNLVESVSGNNVLAGAIQNITNNVQTLQSDANKLTVLSNIIADVDTGNGGHSPHSINLAGAGDGEVVGSINNAFTINKNNGGTWTLSGTNNTITGTGGLKVNGGTLLVNGVVNIASGGVVADVTSNRAALGGSGAINGPVTLTTGFLSPGANGSNAAVASVGALTVGSLNFTGGSNGTFLADITGPAGGGAGVSYDQLRYGSLAAAGVTGGSATNAVRLVLDDASYGGTTGEVFYLIHGGTNANTVVFANPNSGLALNDGDTFTGALGQTYAIHYNDTSNPLGGNDVSLTVVNGVPEPAALGLAGVAGFGLLARRRRARRRE